MATLAAVRVLLSRPETVVVEVRLTVTVPTSERAVVAFAVRVRFWAEAPAASSETVLEVRPVSAVVPVAVRLS